MGIALGQKRRFLLSAYGNETERKFKVTISDNNGSNKQEDEQGMLRYDLGLEMWFLKKMNLRFNTGKYKEDFNNLITNIDAFVLLCNVGALGHFFLH